MKNLDLDQAWKLCKQMWKWIAKKVASGTSLDVDSLKEQWLENHNLLGKLASDCFFCEWRNQVIRDFNGWGY